MSDIPTLAETFTQKCAELGQYIDAFQSSGWCKPTPGAGSTVAKYAMDLATHLMFSDGELSDGEVQLYRKLTAGSGTADVRLTMAILHKTEIPVSCMRFPTSSVSPSSTTLKNKRPMQARWWSSSWRWALSSSLATIT